MRRPEVYQQRRIVDIYYASSAQHPSQPVLEKVKLGEIHTFKKGRVIFPLQSGEGALQNKIKARDTGRTEKRCTVYESLNDAQLYLDNRFWSLSKGFEFTVK